MLTMANNSFLKTNFLYRYDRKNVFYIAHIGMHRLPNSCTVVPLYKYGTSSDIFTRFNKSHKRTFETFEICKVYKTDRKEIVESLFEKEMMIRDMHVRMRLHSKNHTELFLTSPIFTIDDVISMSDCLVEDVNTGKM